MSADKRTKTLEQRLVDLASCCDPDCHGRCDDCPVEVGAAAIVRLRELSLALRKLAVVQHVRMTDGGGTVPNGLSCELCKAEWPDGMREKHQSDCPAGSEGASVEGKT